MKIAAGETRISSPIIIEDGQVVEGQGIGNSVVVMEGQNSYAFIVNLGDRPRVRPVEFRNFTITSDSPRTGGAGILFQGSPSGIRNKVESVYINHQHTGIHFADSVAFTLRDCLFSHNSMRDVVVQNRPESDAGDSTIDGCVHNGMHFTPQAAIYQQDSGGLNIVNCKMLGYSYGYFLNSVPGTATGQLTMIGNSLEHQTNAGIRIGGAGSFNIFQILGNHFTAPNIGIVVDSHQRGRIDNNVMVAVNAGIAFSGGNDWDVTGNSIYDAKEGVHIQAGASNVRVSQNRLQCVMPVNNMSPTSTWDGAH